MGSGVSSVWSAVAFLTRIPVPATTQASPDLPGAVKWFPVVGGGIGALAGVVYAAVGRLSPGLVAAVTAVGVAVAVTGALHEDGLADTFDGLSAGRTVERQLEIMQDSRLGTFGATALVLTLGARVGLVAQLDPSPAAIGALAWAHAGSRAAAVGIMTVARPAAPGLGMAYLTELRRGPLVAVALFTALAGWWVVGPALAWACVLIAAGAVAVWWWARRRIGGVTGDVLGAAQQVALLGALVAVTL
jgi:adenosylcobinamide-GDP ribazoletransferase